MIKYHNNDKITLDDNKEIEDFDWWLEEFNHNYEVGISYATIIMKTGGYKQGRRYEISNPATHKEQVILTEVLKLPEFINSTKL